VDSLPGPVLSLPPAWLPDWLPDWTVSATTIWLCLVWTL
jgi:hypothetical protein